MAGGQSLRRRGKRACPIDDIFIFADATYCEGDAPISTFGRSPAPDQMIRTQFLRRLMHGLCPFLLVPRGSKLVSRPTHLLGVKPTWKSGRAATLGKSGHRAAGWASNEEHAISRWLSGAATYAATHCVLVGSLRVFHDQPLWFAVGHTFAGG